MKQPAFPADAIETLLASYPERHQRLRHLIIDHPLLRLESLVHLAATLPANSIEYNPGNLPVGIDPADVPSPQLSPEETIRSIEQNGSWMVLKRIEQNSEYAALLDDVLVEIEAAVAQRTGAMLGREGFIFVSSPNSVTPFHFDPEHNILMQVRGSKTMTLFDASDESIVDPVAHEAFHLGLHHRNLPWDESFAARGTAVTLTPGDAVYVPVKAPHWVQNGPDVSISLSVTWRSEWSYAEADARAFNRLLRQFGLRPKSPKRYPQSNKAKSLAYRTLRKIGAIPQQ